MSIYSTTVNEIGPNALDFLEENMMVLFGNEAPPELRPYCFMIDMNELNGTIKVGSYLTIENQSYEITAVGEQVEKNLKDLGHITVNFNGSSVPELAGTLYVENKEIEPVSKGTKISIVEK
ncbi:PTS glucitol/sorbitol transporter subunit IIA [Desemzia sp. C1]|uniref:PTS glucitol/sorbitol transporter subunit IIA n=1 Tax=Desemzia sp. C1 TaxID=2892016 RepID=UPI001E5367E9|nr:PTS glucitol/sorbitol transporter subunit IIA [Desemzia sp. C1]MCI3028786.1 PTS glucitol/sorbitol transporter subunit IIA [Desemzia sp. C1]